MTSVYLDNINQHFLNHAVNFVVQQEYRSTTNIINIFSSASSIYLQNSSASSLADVDSSLREIDKLVSQDSAIHSVYFYIPHKNHVAVFGRSLGWYDSDAFYDLESIQSAMDSNSAVSVQQIRSNQYFDNTETTFTKRIKMLNGNILLINFKPDVFWSIFQESIFSNTLNSYLVLGTDNQVFYANFDNISSPLNEDNIASTIIDRMHEHSKDQQFILKINRQRYRVNITIPEQVEWKAVSLTCENDIFISLKNHILVFVLIMVFGCFAVIVFSIFIAKITNAPIIHLKHQLRIPTLQVNDRQRHHSSPLMKNSELSQIAARIAALYNQNNDFYSLEERQLMNTHFLQKQLLSNCYSSAHFFQLCHKYNIPFLIDHPFFLILIDIDATANEDSSIMLKKHLTYFAVDNILSELANDEFIIKRVPIKENYLFICQAKHDYNQSLLESVLNSLQKAFWDFFRLEISCVITPQCDNPTGLSELLQSTDFSNYQYFLSNQRNIFIEDTPPKKEGILSFSSFDEFKRALLSGDFDLCKQQLDLFFSSLQSYTKSSVILSLSVFLSQIEGTLNLMYNEFPNLPRFSYSSMLQRVFLSKRLSLAKAETISFIQTVCHSIFTHISGTYNHVMDKTVSYIEIHYSDPALSSQMLADLVNLSITELNQIYKKIYKQSVSTYIKKYRLERSCLLLKETNLPIEEVAKQVGFENTKYFYSIFKSEYEVTPAKYRSDCSG